MAVFLLGLTGLASVPACHVLAALLAIPTVFSMREELVVPPSIGAFQPARPSRRPCSPPPH